jgi:hypothetical protein
MLARAEAAEADAAAACAEEAIASARLSNRAREVSGLLHRSATRHRLLLS